ncbi:DUF4875 domain-containing protein [Photobacterium damselae]|uniref:DUF4875 domain-containing protein n=1 Tax=Photobacterium damselae TaxID=38293 RepID=UPI002F41ED83
MKKKLDSTGCFVVFFWVIVISFFLLRCSDKDDVEKKQEVSIVVPKEKQDNNKKVNALLSQTSLVKNYKIIDVSDISFAGRTRYKVTIVSPQSKTVNEKLATAGSAAKSILKKEKVNFVSVVLKGDKNSFNDIVVLDFAPDKKGADGDPIGVEFVIDSLPATYLQ